jgi:predicted DNA-binding transcriptional regulator YafY
MLSILTKAMQAPDDLVVSLDYVDSQGVSTRRIVSPIRFLGGNRFLGLCLCREEPRQFYLNRCSNVRLCRAADLVMPVPVFTIAPMAMAAV